MYLDNRRYSGQSSSSKFRVFAPHVRLRYLIVWASRPPVDSILIQATMAQVVDNNEGGQSVALIETPGNAPPIDILEIADPPRQMKVEVSFLAGGDSAH